jgi:hypothetical protein
VFVFGKLSLLSLTKALELGTKISKLRTKKFHNIGPSCRSALGVRYYDTELFIVNFDVTVFCILRANTIKLFTDVIYGFW